MDATVTGLRGLRYNPSRVDIAKVVAPPYDVIDPAQHLALYARDPHNIVRLILGAPGDGRPNMPISEGRYVQAGRDLKAWRDQQILVQDAEPSIYSYRQAFTDANGMTRLRDGFLALRRLVPHGPALRPHEQTLSGPKADRLKLLTACEAVLSPIFCLYTAGASNLTEATAACLREQPLYDVTDEEGVRHQLWRVTGPLADDVILGLGPLPLLIADGHHRYETALNYQALMRSQGKGAGPWDWVLTYFTDTASPGFLVSPIHRLLRQLPAASWREFVVQLQSSFHLIPFRGPRGRLAAVLQQGAQSGFQCGLVGPGGMEMYIMEAQPPHSLDADMAELDTAVLQALLLDKADPLEIVYEHLLEMIWQALEKGGAQAGFILRPPNMRAVTRLAARGMVVPPKTTFFYPKLKTGLVIYAHR